MKLIVFDVDGTLVDSEADIVAALNAAFDAVGARAPHRADMLRIVGLSLPQAMAQLHPEASRDDLKKMTAVYKETYLGQRVSGRSQSVLYPGVRALLDALAARSDVVLGIATGKSRRGLHALLDEHALRHHFVTAQCADDHPSKPDPSMLRAALQEAGVAATNAVMIGDTSYDVDMARAAGVAAIGVGWGYHDRSHLNAASAFAADLPGLQNVLTQFIEAPR